jgi:hypothetical protein
LADTFTALPQDVTQIDRDVLLAAGAYNTATSAQWLVIAGWECQDLSPAGDGAGLAGPRSSTFTDLTRIIVLLQLVQPSRPPAYIVENAAMQHNFNHPRVREHDFQQAGVLNVGAAGLRGCSSVWCARAPSAQLLEQPG